MALLDWIKERLAAKQQPVAEKPQKQEPVYAKEMYAIRDAEELASRKPIELLSEAVKAQAVDDAGPAVRPIEPSPHQDNRQDAQESPTDANRVRAKAHVRGRVRGMER
jgi:hypothetical protein